MFRILKSTSLAVLLIMSFVPMGLPLLLGPSITSFSRSPPQAHWNVLSKTRSYVRNQMSPLVCFLGSSAPAGGKTKERGALGASTTSQANRYCCGYVAPFRYSGLSHGSIPKRGLPSTRSAPSTTRLAASSTSSQAFGSLGDLDVNASTDQDDTIFALSSGFTGHQATAVAIIRISGPRSHEILQSLSSKSSKLPPPRKAVLRKLYSCNDNPVSNDSSTKSSNPSMIDHALVLLFQQPNSFTGEDLVELHCHGSRAVVSQLLHVLPTLGCRMAEPGEFTQRAFGRGKLDLVQVEALADLLGADTSSQLQQALQQLDGQLSSLYDEWRSQLISGLAHAEAVIDFGDDERFDDDYDVDEDSQAQWNVWGNVQERMDSLRLSMESHLQDERRGELVREGVSIAIVGPPNAGKSSLFNLLARRDAAIVSPIAGTTRDVLQVTLDLAGIKCILQDTAGVRSDDSVTNDSLELEGIKRTRKVTKRADLVVAMVDATEVSNGMKVVNDVLTEQRELLDQEQALRSDQVILVLNKLDLIKGKDSMDPIETKRIVDDGDYERQQNSQGRGEEGNVLFGGGTYEISCATQMGVDAFLNGLSNAVKSRLDQGSNQNGNRASACRNNKEGALITRARHRQHVQSAVEALGRFDALSRQGTMAVDMAAEELRLAASELGRITGAVDVEDVLDVLFTDFCIGK